MDPKNTFLELSTLLESVQDGSTFRVLDYESYALLKFVGINAVTSTEICITEITSNKDLPGCPVTKFKRIHRLQNDGWLVFEPSSLHHRRMRVALSPMATKEFLKISAVLDLQLKDLLKKFLSLV